MSLTDPFRKYLDSWTIQSTGQLNTGGAEISTPKFDLDGWYEARVPTTVLAALVACGEYPDPYFGANLKNIPRGRFKQPWWYRKAFELTNVDLNGDLLLEFDGINYAANIWLNGEQLADAVRVRGAFRRFQFDISRLVRKGCNVLALEVVPPRPGDFSTGFVDWNPPAPDRNMGIFRPVTLRHCHSVSIENPFVRTELDMETLAHAELTVTAELANHSDSEVTGTIVGRIESVVGWANAVFAHAEAQRVCNELHTLRLAPHEKRQVVLTAEEFPELQIDEPRFWWPHDLGRPDLYELHLEFVTGGRVCDARRVTFGIRQIDSYFNEQGHRGFRINGKKVLIKAGGWTDDLLLSDTREKLEAQVQYVRQMNLNAIRLEGIWGREHTLYDLCDKNGILMMVGWSCHWEHEQYLGKPVDERFGGIATPEDIDLIGRSWTDQVLWLRNHPSIFVWAVGSDKVPHPDLEAKYLDTFKKHDPTRPYLASTGGVGSEQAIIGSEVIVSDLSGPTGVKMLGPYDYTPPVYWYQDTRRGGAYGFNTETGPGAAVPVLESLKAMIPAEHLWPVDEIWDFHCGLNEFSNLGRYCQALEERYGPADGVEQFAYKAQVLNYELIRPMFEAFRVRKGLATGVVQWMLNAAWPKLYWQLYDWHLMPTGAYYGTKKACEGLQLAYDYANRSVFLVNDTLNRFENVTADIRAIDMRAAQAFSSERVVVAEPLSSQEILVLPEFPRITSTYFLRLRLTGRDGVEIASNFYWLSTRPDVLDYDAKVTPWEYYTPSRQFADFTLLDSLAPAAVDIQHELWAEGSGSRIAVALRNTGADIAFALELKLLDANTSQPVVPIFWTDNYVTLLPGECRTVSATFGETDNCLLAVQSWNTERVLHSL
ncbi:MAG: glycoside hydrolase family 2 TIM barrel-domain containing protein [Planctomycetota bacterium]